MLLTGMALAVPCVIGIVFYAQWLDKRYPDFVPRTLNADEVNAALEQYNKEKEQKDLPSLTLSLLPIVVPIVLIFLKAICSTLATVEGWSGGDASGGTGNQLCGKSSDRVGHQRSAGGVYAGAAHG